MLQHDRKIKKIKRYEGGLEVHIDESVQRDGGSRDEKTTVFKSCDEGAPELKQAWENLQRAVRFICCLPSDWCQDTLEVTGVSFSYSNDIQGACITALAKLETTTSPLVINTPHLPYENYSEGGNQPEMPSFCQQLLCDLESAAGQYLKGVRAQGDMFAEDTTAHPAQAEPLFCFMLDGGKKLYAPKSKVYEIGAAHGFTREYVDKLVAGQELVNTMNAEDELYLKAKQTVIEDQKASTSYVQRKLGIGYDKAARLVERLEENSIISPADHLGKRTVLVSAEGEVENG